jgi:hypothetical protein
MFVNIFLLVYSWFVGRSYIEISCLYHGNEGIILNRIYLLCKNLRMIDIQLCL